jgi:hypothetical protein
MPFIETGVPASWLNAANAMTPHLKSVLMLPFNVFLGVLSGILPR